jgi:translation elongation factor EF-Ts
MGITLDAIDAVRARTGVSYRRAYEALQAADGDVVQAILALEDRGSPWLRKRGEDLKDEVRRLLREGSATRVVVRSREGRTVAAVPAIVAVAGSLMFPLATVAGVAAALWSHASIAIER